MAISSFFDTTWQSLSKWDWHIYFARKSHIINGSLLLSSLILDCFYLNRVFLIKHFRHQWFWVTSYSAIRAREVDKKKCCLILLYKDVYVFYMSNKCRKGDFFVNSKELMRFVVCHCAQVVNIVAGSVFFFFFYKMITSINRKKKFVCIEDKH